MRRNKIEWQEYTIIEHRKKILNGIRLVSNVIGAEETLDILAVQKDELDHFEGHVPTNRVRHVLAGVSQLMSKRMTRRRRVVEERSPK